MWGYKSSTISILHIFGWLVALVQLVVTICYRWTRNKWRFCKVVHKMARKSHSHISPDLSLAHWCYMVIGEHFRGTAAVSFSRWTNFRMCIHEIGNRTCPLTTASWTGKQVPFVNSCCARNFCHLLALRFGLKSNTGACDGTTNSGRCSSTSCPSFHCGLIWFTLCVYRRVAP